MTADERINKLEDQCRIIVERSNHNTKVLNEKLRETELRLTKLEARLQSLTRRGLFEEGGTR